MHAARIGVMNAGEIVNAAMQELGILAAGEVPVLRDHRRRPGDVPQLPIRDDGARAVPALVAKHLPPRETAPEFYRDDGCADRNHQHYFGVFIWH